MSFLTILLVDSRKSVCSGGQVVGVRWWRCGAGAVGGTSCGDILWKTTFWMEDLPARRAPIRRTRGFVASAGTVVGLEEAMAAAMRAAGGAKTWLWVLSARVLLLASSRRSDLKESSKKQSFKENSPLEVLPEPHARWARGLVCVLSHVASSHGWG